MPNTEHLGFNYRGKAWSDGEPILRVTLPDGTIAEGMAALGYAWDSNTATFFKIPGDSVNGIKVQVTSTPASGGLTDTQLRASAVPVDGSGVTQPVSGSLGRSWSLDGESDSVHLTDSDGNEILSTPNARPKLVVQSSEVMERLDQVYAELRRISAVLIEGLGVQSNDFLIEEAV